MKLVKDAGQRIDGAGFQGHFTVGQTPSRQDLASHLKRFTDLGVEVRENYLPYTYLIYI